MPLRRFAGRKALTQCVEARVNAFLPANIRKGIASGKNN